MKCNTCDRIIQGIKKVKKSGKEYFYYYCHVCDNKYLNEVNLERQIQEKLKNLVIDDNIHNQILKELKNIHKEKIKFVNHTRLELNNKYNQIQNQLDSLLKLRIDNEIDKTEYKSNRINLLSHQEDIKEKLLDLENSDRDFFSKAEKVLEFANNAHILFKNSNKFQRRELIDKIGWNHTLTDLTFSFSYIKPLNMLENLSKNSDLKKWGACSDKTGTDFKGWFENFSSGIIVFPDEVLNEYLPLVS